MGSRTIAFLHIFGRLAGFTLIELIVTMAIMSILAAGILPLSQGTYTRTKELELTRNLRIIRTSLDEYKKLSDEGKIPKNADESGYPKSLEILVEGVDIKDAVVFKKKFLRKIPKDPFSENGKWGLRSYFDEPESETWGGQDIYDIYSTSDKQALDGSYYKDW
jgi:general secretion pathway protein G